MSEKRNIFAECRETIQEIGKANGKEGKAAAMLAGATQGWTSPAADPNRYSERGRPIKSRRHNRGDAR